MAKNALFLLRSQSKHISSTSFLSGYSPSKTGTWSSIPSIKSNFNSSAPLSRSWASQATMPEDDNFGVRKGAETAHDIKDTGVIYQGPISSTLKKVKMLSLSTCCLSVSLGPVVTFMTSTDSNVILKGAVASSVIFFSASTTYALHWFVSPYIHKLKWQPGADSFDVEMMSWLGTYVPRTIKFADIRLPETQRPFVTFKADGTYYYIDADHCPNKALLARLTPQKGTHESAFKNL